MRSNLVKSFLICFLIGFFIFSSSSTVFAGGGINVQLGKGSDSDQPKYVKNNKNGGPAPHAPAHGYRAKHQYRYYPSNSVYYDTGRGLYFYLKGDNWEVGASLPSNFRVGLGDSVSIELDTDKPYIYHAEHVKEYKRSNWRIWKGRGTTGEDAFLIRKAENPMGNLNAKDTILLVDDEQVVLDVSTLMIKR